MGILKNNAGHIFLAHMTFLLFACNSSGGSAANSDNPLLPQQWYYKNTGQSSYAGLAGSVGKGLDVAAVHAQGITGRDITVMINDDGLDMKHEDLRTSHTGSHNVHSKSNDPTPAYPTDAHGTAVAGIINMQDNAIGGLGIAPGTTVRGINFIGHDSEGRRVGRFDRRDDLHMFGLYERSELDNDFDESKIQVTNVADIFNNSWGAYSCSSDDFNNVTYAYARRAHEGRNGKGYIYVKSAGNGFSGADSCICDEADSIKVSCHNANDPSSVSTSIPEFIITGAYNADGKASSYSSHGSNLWISAPGGEFGFQSDRAIRTIYGLLRARVLITSLINYYYKPAMVSTDLSGCARGYSSHISNGEDKDIRNPSTTDFNYDYDPGLHGDVIISYVSDSGLYRHRYRYTSVGSHSDNRNCNYTSTMSGTSSAAPSTSGVIALLLEVNPNFTWRDIKHILASSAINDSEDSVLRRDDIYYEGHKVDDGWTENAAEYRFSNAYGFGRLNAEKAVKYAQEFSADSFGEYMTVEKESDQTEIDVTGDVTIEHVRVEVTDTCDASDASSCRAGGLLITLTSPRGTKSILFWPKSSFTGTKGSEGNKKFNENGLINASMASNAFYHEKAQGIWSLAVTDVDVSGDANPLEKWKIEINGHK